MEYYERGCVFWYTQECFYHMFCLSGDLFPAVFLYCSVGVRSRICWYLCHAEALSVAWLSPWSSVPLFFSPTATFDLAGCHPKNCPNFQTCHPHTWHAKYCEQLPFMYVCGQIFIHTHLTWTLTFSTSENSYCIAVYQVHSVLHRLSAVSVVLHPFMLPVPHITLDQATNYSCWHEPPSNSTSLCCLALSPCLQSCHSSPSIQVCSSPPPPLPL